jgi:DNA-binding response OmpR family regulator
MGRLITFPPFRVDATNEVLWRNAETIPLRPKSFALLRYLADHLIAENPLSSQIEAVEAAGVGGIGG